MSYDEARTLLEEEGGAIRATADVVTATGYEHLGIIYRMGAHAVRMPYLTLTTFLTPQTFTSSDRGIDFVPANNTLLLASGGVRKSASAGFWRRRVDSASDIMVGKGLADRYELKGDPPPPPSKHQSKRHRAAEPALPDSLDDGVVHVQVVSAVGGRKRVVRDLAFTWKCRNARFTFEGAVDVCAAAAVGGPRLLFDSDELSLTIAAQGQRDASILAIGELINLLDAYATASKVAAGTRRSVPKGAKVACMFGCQPGRARDYIAAWDPLNIGSRFWIYCVGEREVLTTTYAQLHARRTDTTLLFDSKIQLQIDGFFGDQLVGEDTPEDPDVAALVVRIALCACHGLFGRRVVRCVWQPRSAAWRSTPILHY